MKTNRYILALLLLSGCGSSQGPVMVAVIFGQSNAANFDQTQHVAGPNVLMIQNGQLLHAQDPISDANGTVGSVWPLVGDKLIESGAYSKVIIYNVAVGGTGLNLWSKSGEFNEKITDAVKLLRAMNLEPTHIFVHQGETDAGNKTDPATYEYEMYYIIQELRAMDVKAPFFVSRATVCQGLPYQPIRDAQQAIVNDNENTFAGPDTDQITLSERWDQCHFGTVGQGIASDLWVKAITMQSKVYQPYIAPID